MIPCIDIGPLFEGHSATRAVVDAEFFRAAEELGFIQVRGFDGYVDVSLARRQALKRIFSLPTDRRELLYRRKFAAGHDNVYRGWFPVQEGHPTRKEGIDLGPDLVAGYPGVDPSDPLCERTPLPHEADLPGWLAESALHYRQMELLGAAIMRCIARGLGLNQAHFDEMFQNGISTLRLIHYPSTPGGSAPQVIGAAHVDSGLVTLLLQDDVSGLQVRNPQDDFLDVPAREDTLTVNFGRLLALWSGGRIRATEHRVVGGGQSRFSFPFFYEPRADALIEPLPGTAARFRPFLYGDFLWQATTRFIEFRGLEQLRRPRGDFSAAAAAVGA